MPETTPPAQPGVPVTPAPALTSRSVTGRGIWLTAPGAGAAEVWVPEEVLAEADAARAEGRWVQTDTLSQEDALVAAGLARRDGLAVDDEQSSFVRGTEQLRRLLHPALGEDGAVAYDPAVHGPFYSGDPGTAGFDAHAEAEGFLRCLGCGRLPVKYSRNRYYDNTLSVEYDNALLVALSGGYAMFVDQEPVQVALCHDCAHDLCDRFPRLAAAIGDPVNGHAHTERYLAEHPDHRGWDIPEREPSPSSTPTPPDPPELS